MTEMKDSGERQSFETGAVRDAAADKPRPDLISPFADEREGEWMRLGALKYSEHNWEHGIPISRCIASLRRHLMAYMMGKIDEDHMAAVRTNASFILHFEHEIAAGRLPASLDDIPKYEKRKPLAQMQIGVDLANLNESDQMVQYAERTEMQTEVAQAAAAYCERRKAEKLSQMATTPYVHKDFIPGKPTPVGLISRVQDQHGKAPYILYDAERIYIERAPTSAVNYWQVAWPPVNATTPVQKPTLYIAGPMRGKPRLNWDAFFDAEAKLQAAGYNVINPARLDQERGIDPDTFDPETDLAQNVLRQIVVSDLMKIANLDPARGDGIALLDGWDYSVGARAEYHVAEWLRLTEHGVAYWCNPALDHYADSPIKPEGYREPHE